MHNDCAVPALSVMAYAYACQPQSNTAQLIPHDWADCRAKARSTHGRMCGVMIMAMSGAYMPSCRGLRRCSRCGPSSSTRKQHTVKLLWAAHFDGSCVIAGRGRVAVEAGILRGKMR